MHIFELGIKVEIMCTEVMGSILKCSFCLTLCFLFVFWLFFCPFRQSWQLCFKNVGCVQAPVRGSAQGLRGECRRTPYLWA